LPPGILYRAVGGLVHREPAQPTPPSTAKLALAPVVGLAFFAALILLPAGRLDWLLGWAHVALLALCLPVTLIYLQRVNPDVITHRMVIKAGTETWDKIWGAVFGILFPAIYVVAGLDARWGWSPMPAWSWGIGVGLFLLSGGVLVRSMGENPFFEKTVRIQTDRGHRVIDTGPYGVVRHPGYVGFLGWLVSVPLLLGSAWAFAPAAAAMLGLVVRTALEDRTLQAKLPGYCDYAARVRWRLIPGVW
jgi:protein-S-isoprenylcysteine O-methyltransferase Ste14